MSGDISLFDLVNVSIGTPEPGAVNFSALHTLLHAILEHLQIQNVNAVWSEADAGHGPGELLLAAACPQNPYRRMEDKLRHMERQLAALEHLPSGSELLSRSASVNDVWQLLQLRRRVEGSEDGVTKCVSLIQDLLMEIRELKESRDSLKKEVENLQIQCNQINVDQLVDRVTAVEHCLHHVEDLKSATKVLKDKVALYPEPEDLTQCVTWEVMQAALFSGRQKTKKDPKDSATGTGLTRMALNVGNCVSPAAGLPGMAESRSSDGPVLGSSQIPPSQQGLLKESEGVLPLLVSQPLSRISSGAQRYPETVEALRDVGRLQEKHKNLESRVECLEGCKADRDQVQQLRELLSDSERDIPENIREQVNHLNGLMETVLTDRDKTSELVGDVQGAILQLQAECEKLHITANQLIEDHSQKQNHIDYLYKAIEELDEKKADREVVEMEIGIKADKRALESKVSRTQFDTMTEQLNGMFQELLSKITGQEQDWNKVINKISTEMESKLNRIELDPLKKQLEDRWKSIRKQLQIQPAPEHDDAAGFRKQLVARFHCISCDRPVDMTTPGSHLMTVPSAPGLPSHKSNRPYTIYELEQVRQHSKSEHIPEMATYSYLAMSRSCGGSHTLTYTNRRYSRLQHITQLIQTEDDGLAMSSSGLRVQPEEVDILGLDGHIYKGRLNTRAVKTLESRLPTISSKEGICKSKNWGRHCQSQKCSGAEPGRRSPLRPQSGSRSASSSSVKDRLVPSMDCLFQPCAPQSSAEPDNELLQDRELHRDFSQSQNAPVTSL
ncbi:uncharacterized protein [Salminus brasiliensis]|uniref:uncharacterized protein isoform X2 n=1 Tax=Salminus brasiliensis TaxID=930266 RepID=UPI003B82F4C4